MSDVQRLWPHQERGLKELADAIENGHSRVCVASPTGGGKTRMICEHILASDCAQALYTDRRMLLSQTASVLESRGIRFGYRASGHEPRLIEDIQLAMVQTETSRVLKGSRDIHPAKLVYIDEAHKNAGDSMQQLMALHAEECEEVAHVGFTATPLGIDHFYDELVVAGTNSELRDCGALVMAYHYAPDEPDTKWIGKVKIDEGECGIPVSHRMQFAHRVFGSVVEHYDEYNPGGQPSILFAPGVEESIWMAEELSHNGIKAAHIDGQNIWVDGRLETNTDELREEIAERHKRGEIKVVCNRFVLREGIDWPWAVHGIFATIFGSLTAYIQAGGRFLRAHPGKHASCIQDHGGNWWRHGSLNVDRQWRLSDNDRTVAGVRAMRLREKKEPEPVVCPKCHAIRLSGPRCHTCGYEHKKSGRMILQKNGTLREMHGDIFKPRRYMDGTKRDIQEWCARVRAVQKSKKPTVQQMTFAQVEANFAREHNWKFPGRDWPMMPVKDADWFRPIPEVSHLSNGAAQANKEMAQAAAEGW